MAADPPTPVNRTAASATQATQLDNLLQGYRLYARTEGKSPKTINITTTAVSRLKDFLVAAGLPTDAREIGAREIREFILYLQQVRAYEHHPFTRPRDGGLSGQAINCYLRSVRAFWSWLVRDEIVGSNPFSRVKIPRPPKKVIATFSDTQLASLFKAIDIRAAAGFRDWTMILTLLDTGLRASELVGLTLEHVNLEDGMMKVLGKGSKERVVPIGAKVQRSLWKYRQHYRPQPANPLCSSLFLARDGRPITLNRLERIIGQHARKAGIQGVRCSPHTFRHTFAISYLRNGGDVFSLQRILGHSTLDTVRTYVNMADADVKACHRRFSPADNLDVRCKIRA